MSRKHNESSDNAVYDLGAVCRLTGLTPHVLRSWESRHGVVKPRRLSNGRRAYSSEDLRHLQRLKTLTAHGHRIGTLSKLSAEELDKRLEQLGLGDPPPATAVLGVTVIGETLAARSQHWVLDPPACIGARYQTDAEAVKAPGRSENEVLVLEAPTMHEETPGLIADLAAELGAQHTLVNYRFGPQRQLARELPDNMTLCRGVLSAQRLNAEVARLVLAGQARALQSKPLKTRRYTPAQLANISAMASTVACECPRHVSLLLSELIDFEDYSAECENRKPGDEELHRYLNEVTARARNLMEQALARILEQEQLTV